MAPHAVGQGEINATKVQPSGVESGDQGDYLGAILSPDNPFWPKLLDPQSQ